MRSTPEKYIANARVYRGNVSRRHYVFKSYNTPPLFIVASGTLFSLQEQRVFPLSRRDSRLEPR